MARPRRFQFPGAHYHVTDRGNAKGDIFYDDHDRHDFLCLMHKVAIRLRWDVLAYCLMPNHYHLFVATPDPSLSAGIQRLNGTYALRFNRRHDRVGHLFQGRFKAALVDSQAYLLAVIRYIAWNPVKAGFCRVPEDWRWSSHAAAMGLAPGVGILAWDRVLGEFGPDPESGVAEYMKFISDIAGSEQELGEFTNPQIIGDKTFTEAMSERARCIAREVVREERASKPLAAYFATSTDRNVAIRAAYQTGVYSLSDIARYLKLHYSTISKICRTTEESETTPPLPFDEDRQFKI